MKCAALIASLLVMVQATTDPTGGYGSCKGKKVDVFLDSSFVNGGDVFSDPDTYIKMTIGDVTNTTAVTDDKKYVTFKYWIAFGNPQSDILEIEVWDQDGELNGDDDLMGKCRIPLKKAVSQETCTFDSGEVSLVYVCM